MIGPHAIDDHREAGAELAALRRVAEAARAVLGWRPHFDATSLDLELSLDCDDLAAALAALEDHDA